MIGMENPNEVFSLLLLLGLLTLVVGVFIRISIRVRRDGGSLTTVVLGSTDHFLTKEKSKAAETIVDENAGKKFESQASRQPKDPGNPDA
jgi:hypothetical protein